MSDHKGLPVAGYRPQTGAAIDLVNDNKAMEERILRTLDALANSPDIDKRWLAVGRTHIEQGFMAVNRAIFRPGRLALPGDPLPAPIDSLDV
ncbi:cyclic nucleotide-binding protein [Ancylobacter sp. TS-1]|uniref:Acb2/Tad1 domain-containing protein n=1 Tax=Ancylobacter sp. TS-1 TaxID=1850374 RepID=UPI001265C819|nr:cyclic nucleotide-binding protein [Ancylobacter sp. TS-1]QFR32388.1 cyclic nucleotide-binding protein [Ancylobacter sp. TS-1]